MKKNKTTKKVVKNGFNDCHGVKSHPLTNIFMFFAFDLIKIVFSDLNDFKLGLFVYLPPAHLHRHKDMESEINNRFLHKQQLNNGGTLLMIKNKRKK